MAPVWKTSAAESPDLIRAERTARQERAAAERLRLLYVAMTRARTWLIVTAAGEVDKPDCWYDLIRNGMERLNPVSRPGGIKRHEFGIWPDPLPLEPQVVLPAALPSWAFAMAPKPVEAPPVLSPSDLGGHKALPGEANFDLEEAKARGSALHLLLEHLPSVVAEAWSARTVALIPDPDRAAAALQEARRILEDPSLTMLFAGSSLAEVGITGEWNGRRLAGSIDRLVLTPGHALIVDYKSNAILPQTPSQVPEGILRQLGAYAHVLAQIYPDRRIETAILWTRGPRLMRLDPEIVRQALARTTIP